MSNPFDRHLGSIRNGSRRLVEIGTAFSEVRSVQFK